MSNEVEKCYPPMTTSGLSKISHIVDLNSDAMNYDHCINGKEMWIFKSNENKSVINSFWLIYQNFLEEIIPTFFAFRSII